MKKFLFLVIVLFAFLGMSAQTIKDGKKVMKVSYITTPLSPNMISLLKKNSPSPEVYNQTISLIQKQECFYSLYINLKNMESVFVLDSIHSQPGVSAFGQINEVYTDSQNNFLGTEDFINSKNYFKGNLYDLKWKVTNEEKKIGGYSCTKFIEEKHNDIEIWVCTDIAINRGPGYFQSPLGLVFEASDFFGMTQIKGIKYLDSTDSIERYRPKNISEKYIPLKEELALKDNAIQTMHIDKGQN
jgi:GLPGLI family protein